MKNIILGILLIICLALVGCSSEEIVIERNAEPAQPPPAAQEVQTPPPATDPVAVAQPTSQTHKVRTAGLTFTPDTLSIKAGDTVEFTNGPSHNVQEIEKATYDANGKTAKAGGFEVGFGQTGSVTFDTPGTYYYVCQPHAGAKMKGKIEVK